MRRILITVLFMTTAPAVNAGIYSTAEPVNVVGGRLEPDVSPSGVKPLPLEIYEGALGERIGISRDPNLLGFSSQPAEKKDGEKKEPGFVAKRKDYLAKADALQKKINTGSATVDDQINLSAY